MGKLTGKEILRQIELGHIEIDPFDKSRINPNSYNMRLAHELKVYKPNYTYYMNGKKEVRLDAHAVNETEDLIIPDKGLLLRPNTLYLGRTVERTFTDRYVPHLDGRSSTGRLGMFIHVTAGFGDIGFDGTWTLEIFVIHPLVIYPYDEIGQISFETVEGDTSYQYNGRYNHQSDVTESRFYMDKKGEFRDDE